MFIERLKLKFKVDEPIFTSEILELFQEFSRAYVFRLIKTAENTKELIKFSNGVYYLPQFTVVGMSTITAADVVYKKYISNNGEVYGIFSGINLLNGFHLTTQMANTIEVVTNNETMRCRTIKIDGRNIILRKSRFLINKENEKLYLLLQLFSELNINYFNNKNKETIVKYINVNRIKVYDLINYAKYFPAHTTKNIVISGVLNDITQGYKEF